jgi:hypothetical protein
VDVKREPRMHDVYRVFQGRSTDAPMFPLESFAVHSVPFTFVVNWFEEILDGEVIDEKGLPGIYGFELKERVDTPEALIEVLRDEAGLVITREQREISTLIVRQRKAECEKLTKRPIAASGAASPKRIAERRGEQRLAQGVPPPKPFLEI